MLRETKFGADEAEVELELLNPTHHLVAPMYTAFRAHVMSKDCRVKRRKLTKEQKSEMEIMRRGDAWYIDVVINKLAQRTHSASSAAPKRSSK